MVLDVDRMAEVENVHRGEIQAKREQLIRMPKEQGRYMWRREVSGNLRRPRITKPGLTCVRWMLDSSHHAHCYSSLCTMTTVDMIL